MKSNIYEWFGASMLTLSLLLAGCSSTNSVETPAQAATTAASVEVVEFDNDDLNNSWSDSSAEQIKLNGTSISTTAKNGVFIENSTVTIALPGTYVVSGELENGQIKVKLENKGNVQLVLNGANIHNENQAGIYIEEAGKTIITLAEGTKNSVSDGEVYQFEDGEDEPTGTIFSKDDLTINGTGTLNVHANYNNAIVSKDTLKLVEGNYNVTSVDDGIVGRDILAIKNGSYSLDVQGDAMKTTNDNADQLGKVYVLDGQFQIKAGNDGINSIGSVTIENGQYNMITGNGSQASLEDESSAKGIKAATELVINNGTFVMDSADDAIHSNSNVTISNGQFDLKTADDGFHADNVLTINDGIITVSESYEGLEGQQIHINGGKISLNAQDDGVNVSGGNDQSAFGGRGGATFSSNSDALLKITGGEMYVNAAGDGLDSNGNIEMTGGTVVVSGPENNGNGALDYDGSFNISGGTLIAAGASGMAMAPSEESSQHALLMYYPTTQAADTMVQLVNEDNEVLISFKPDKSYQSIMISSPLIEEGKTYSLYAGGQSELDETLLLGIQLPAQLGTAVTGFTVSEMISYVDENGITTAQSGIGGPGGMGGGFGGGRGTGGTGNVEGESEANGQRPTPPEGATGEMQAPTDWENGEMPERPEGMSGEMPSLSSDTNVEGSTATK